MYTVKHGGDIHKGDLIAVSNGNDFSVGIYFGRGTGGTVQYYGTGTAGYCKKRYEERLKIGANKGEPFKLNQLCNKKRKAEKGSEQVEKESTMKV